MKLESISHRQYKYKQYTTAINDIEEQNEIHMRVNSINSKMYEQLE